MKKFMIIAILVSGFAVLTAFNSTNSVENSKTETFVQSDFCEGWDDGYQEALDGCLKVGVTPVCPIPPVGKNSYKHGYGMGYAKGQKKCEE